jgi:uncharacterized glyoxalase superfamily protein PhnB
MGLREDEWQRFTPNCASSSRAQSGLYSGLDAPPDALHDHLIEHGTPIVFAPKDGPFGRYFAFRDPFGYTITPHTVAPDLSVK